MSIALYEVSVPVFIRGLTTLNRLLDKASSQASTRGYPVELLLHSRFYPDMYPLAGQLERLSQIPLEACSLLTNQALPHYHVENPQYQDYIHSLQHSLQLLHNLQPEGFVAAMVQPVSTTLAGKAHHFTDGLQYLLQQAQPNFYFHLTTAYNLLRHNGVALAKQDYLGI